MRKALGAMYREARRRVAGTAGGKAAGGSCPSCPPFSGVEAGVIPPKWAAPGSGSCTPCPMACPWGGGSPPAGPSRPSLGLFDPRPPPAPPPGTTTTTTTWTPFISPSPSSSQEATTTNTTTLLFLRPALHQNVGPRSAGLSLDPHTSHRIASYPRPCTPPTKETSTPTNPQPRSNTDRHSRTQM